MEKNLTNVQKLDAEKSFRVPTAWLNMCYSMAVRNHINVLNPDVERNSQDGLISLLVCHFTLRRNFTLINVRNLAVEKNLLKNPNLLSTSNVTQERKPTNVQNLDVEKHLL